MKSLVKKIWLLLPLFVFLCVNLTLTSCGKDDKGEPEPPIPVWDPAGTTWSYQDVYSIDNGTVEDTQTLKFASTTAQITRELKQIIGNEQKTVSYTYNYDYTYNDNFVVLRPAKGETDLANLEGSFTAQTKLELVNTVNKKTMLFYKK